MAIKVKSLSGSDRVTKHRVKQKIVSKLSSELSGDVAETLTERRDVIVLSVSDSDGVHYAVFDPISGDLLGTFSVDGALD